MLKLTKYELTTSPGKYHVYRFGEVDLTNLTDERADILFNQGFPYLKKVSPIQKTPRKKGSSGKLKKLSPDSPIEQS